MIVSTQQLILLCLILSIVLPISVYLSVRFGAFAFFRTKLEYMKNLGKALEGEESND